MAEISRELLAKQLHYVFSNLKDGVCVMNKTGILLYVNPAARELFRIPFKSTDTEKLWEFIPYVEKNDALIQLFIDAVTSGRVEQQAFVTYENEAGDEFHLRVCMNYTPEEGGIFIVLLNNLTDLFRVNTAFARYTSPRIAAYVLGSPEGEKRGGESRMVSILMSDLRDFTGMASELGPDRLVELLNHYFEKMVEVIEKRKGTVIEFLGDGIFAVFGAPEKDPSHASDAVKCAIEMQNRMKEINAWNLQNGYPALSMGIGINSGMAVVGNIGSTLKMKYGCMGDVVNIAGRTESITVGGQVCITETTRDMISEPLRIRAEHTIQVKGRKAPLTICDVLGIGRKLHLAEQKSPVWKETAGEAYETTVYLVVEKIITGKGMPGLIKGISEDNRCALLYVGAQLGIMQNLMLSVCGELYAKVTGSEGDDYIITFVSAPEGFDEWIEEITNG